MTDADNLVPGARRISAIQIAEGVALPHCERFWVDFVMYDIASTMMRAVRAAHSSGSCAVVFPSFLVRMTKYAELLAMCCDLGMTIIVADCEYDPELWDIHGTFKRRVYWRPGD